MAESRFKNLSGTGPFSGKRVLIASSPAVYAKLSTVLAAWGADLIAFRAIEIRKISDASALRSSFACPKDYAWIVFSSSYGVRFFLEHLGERGLSRTDFASARVCAVGPSTARSLADNGWQVDLIPSEFVGEGILEALARETGGLEALRGKRVLLPRAREARDVIVDALTGAGAAVQLLPCYETIQAPADPSLVKAVLEYPPDLMIFTSSSNVTGFVGQVGMENGRSIFDRTTVAALGPVVASTVRSHGKEPEIIPKRSTIDDLLNAIQEYFSGT